jgi:hypothetical protein
VPTLNKDYLQRRHLVAANNKCKIPKGVLKPDKVAFHHRCVELTLKIVNSDLSRALNLYSIFEVDKQNNFNHSRKL